MIAEHQLRLLEAATEAYFELGPYQTSGDVRQYQLPFHCLTRAIKSLNHFQVPSGMNAPCAKRKLEFLSGRLCARRAIRSLCNSDTHVGAADDRSPQWPTGIIGSISHTSCFATAAVASSFSLRSIGVDSETIVERDVAEIIRNDCLTSTERDYFSRLHFCSTVELLTLAFSAKEAVYKALYPLTRQFLEFQDIELKEFDASINAFQVEILRNLGSGLSVSRLGIGRFSLTSHCIHTCFEVA